MKKDKQFWLKLSERYFEAETTDEEERELRRFAAQTSDPDFRELQAVMGFTSMGRPQTLKPSNPQTVKLSTTPHHLISIAASVIVVLGLSLFFSLNNRQQDTGCVAWVNGEKVTDPTAVMALMQNTMRDMSIDGSDPVEDQLRDMFELLQTPQTPQTMPTL